MLSSYTTSGFYRAPISKGLLGGVVLSSLAFNIPLSHHRHLCRCGFTTLFEKGQIWRLASSKIAFLDTKDIVLGAVLFYYFRIFERRYGSQKFASYLLACSTISMVLEATALYTCNEWGIKHLSSGPFSLLFSLFVPYFCDIPRVAITHFFGIPVTGKSFTYIIGLQLASDSRSSFLSAICGILAGILYRKDFLNVQSWLRIPNIVADICERTLGSLLKSSPPEDLNTPTGATLELQRREEMERLEQQAVLQQMREMRRHQRPMIGNPLRRGIFGNGAAGPNGGAAVAVPPDVDEVSEEQVQRLIEMGFQRDNILHALRVTNNDVTMATNILLQQ